MPRSNDQKGYVDPVLSHLALDYAATALKGLAGSKIFPTVPVPKKDARYAVFSKNNAVLEGSTRLSDNGDVPRRVSMEQGYAFVNADDYGLMQTVDEADAQMMEGAFSNAKQRAVRNLTRKLILDEEVRARELLKTLPSGHKANLSGDGTGKNNQWSGSGGDPVAKITEIAKGMYVQPNVLVLGRDVMFALRENAALKDAVKNVVTSGNPLLIDESLLSHVFRIPNVHVAQPFHFGHEKKTGAGAPSYIWDGLVFLGYVAESPGADDLTFGARFAVDYPQAGANGWMVSRWFDHAPGVRGAETIKVSGSFEYKIMSPDCGHLLTGVVA
ncbi:MAG: hypothetical protein AAF975_00050 [Spirochaetota bacterium]